MSRLLEDQGKALLQQAGVPVPRHVVATTPAEARAATQALGVPVMLKALVPIGGRGKAGGVRPATSAEEAEAVAHDLLGRSLGPYPVERLLIEERLSIAQELFVSISFDSSRRCPVILASSEGGVEIEALARQRPDHVRSLPIDPLLGFHPYMGKELWARLGLRGAALTGATEVVTRLVQLFAQVDATILEVNPLAMLADGRVVAAAVLLAVDDDALYRQPSLQGVVQPGTDRAWRPLTTLERQAIAVDRADPYRGTARYTEMDGGDIGLLSGGGGGSLLVYDTLLQCGGRPANYTEFGGNPTEEKVYGLVKVILSKPGVRGFLLDANITNNTQTDVVARGLLRAFQELGIHPATFPVVVRLAGVNEAEARRLLEQAGIEYHGDDVTMEDACLVMVEKMRAAPDPGTASPVLGKG
ncbi:MAG: acetate--CoA ligase family protein [Deltaproteobacteria bacterium]|nr:acetate--CoA ligase family protein [Deltaproteobacteria bacterium]